MVNKVLFFVMVFVLGSGILPSVVDAAKITASPNSGSYTTGDHFSINVVIDGETQSFNAAKASVTVSNNLLVEDIVLGNCNFSFVDTPTVSELAFIGALLGTSKQNCTLYTLKLVPLSQGTGQIIFSNASIKRLEDASEILNGVKNGSYTFSGNTITPSVIPAVIKNENGQPYELSLKIYSKNDEPVKGATVIITPQSAQSNSKSIRTTTDMKGVADFKELPEGVHLVTVERDGKKIAENIITVGGSNQTMVLSIQEKKSELNWFIVTIIGVIILSIIAVIAIHFRMKKNATSVK